MQQMFCNILYPGSFLALKFKTVLFSVQALHLLSLFMLEINSDPQDWQIPY
jgi:hypothetical protein